MSNPDPQPLRTWPGHGWETLRTMREAAGNCEGIAEICGGSREVGGRCRRPRENMGHPWGTCACLHPSACLCGGSCAVIGNGEGNQPMATHTQGRAGRSGGAHQEDCGRDAWCVGSWPEDLEGSATWRSRGISCKPVTSYVRAYSPGTWNTGLGPDGKATRTPAHLRPRPPAGTRMHVPARLLERWIAEAGPGVTTAYYTLACLTPVWYTMYIRYRSALRRMRLYSVPQRTQPGEHELRLRHVRTNYPQALRLTSKTCDPTQSTPTAGPNYRPACDPPNYLPPATPASPHPRGHQTTTRHTTYRGPIYHDRHPSTPRCGRTCVPPWDGPPHRIPPPSKAQPRTQTRAHTQTRATAFHDVPKPQTSTTSHHLPRPPASPHTPPQSPTSPPAPRALPWDGPPPHTPPPRAAPRTDTRTHADTRNNGRPPSVFLIQTCEFGDGVSNKRCSHQGGHILASFKYAQAIRDVEAGHAHRQRDPFTRTTQKSFRCICTETH